MYSTGPDIPAIFIVFVFIAILVAGGSALWRVSVARRIAERNGLDPRDATAVALLNDNGLSAAYVRGGLQGQRPPTTPAATPQRTPAQRLADIESLHAAGKLTDEEYAAARKRIIDSL